MRMLTDSWTAGYLDYARSPGDYRVRVRRWHVVMPVGGLAVSPVPDWRRGLNYLREIGPASLARKAVSRLQERWRGGKYLAIGLGEVAEADPGAPIPPGRSVAFLAPAGPRCVERLVLPTEFLLPVERGVPAPAVPKDALLFSEGGTPERLLALATRFAGWSSESGLEIDKAALRRTLEAAEDFLAERGVEGCVAYGLTTPSAVWEVNERASPVGAVRAVAWGYGHHMRTMVIPNVARRLSVVKVHEVDPVQIGPAQAFPFGCDTSAAPREPERYDVHLVAGFHHTHGPLAAHALRQGAAVVVEKPLVTTHQQLDDLLAALRGGSGRLFGGFQKRYVSFNKAALRDLRVSRGEPVSYHAIVHEVPLPPYHWYRWPNSGSGLLSHGCHWIDHFLFLNGFSPVTTCDVWEGRSEDIVAVMELENGATLSLTLTHQGSSRIGVQDHIELRANGVTVQMRNTSRYFAEDGRRVIRRLRANKTRPYTLMYRSIADRILAGQPGDDPTETERSARAVLMLEERLQAKRKHAGVLTSASSP